MFIQHTISLVAPIATDLVGHSRMTETDSKLAPYVRGGAHSSIQNSLSMPGLGPPLHTSLGPSWVDEVWVENSKFVIMTLDISTLHACPHPNHTEK